jgi:hypothetical protein
MGLFGKSNNTNGPSNFFPSKEKPIRSSKWINLTDENAEDAEDDPTIIN